MAQVGDRVEIKAKTGARAGVVISVSGSLLRLRWDTGEETTLVPAPGVLRVVGAADAPRVSSGSPSRGTKKRAAPAKARPKSTVRTPTPPAGTAKAATKVARARTTPAPGGAVGKKIAAAAGGAKPRKKQPSEPELSAALRTDDKKKKSKKGDKKKKR